MPANEPTIFSAYQKHVKSFAALHAETWQLIESILEIRELKKGEYSLEEGKTCSYIDFIYKGSFRAFANKDGEEITTGLYLENNFLTNMKSLSTATPSHLYLQAMENSVIVRLYKDTLVGLYDQSNELQSLGRSILESMIVTENEWKEMYTLYDPEQRYRFLFEKSPELVQRFSLQYIASFLGIRRETLSRIRSRFARG